MLAAAKVFQLGDFVFMWVFFFVVTWVSSWKGLDLRSHKCPLLVEL